MVPAPHLNILGLTVMPAVAANAVELAGNDGSLEEDLMIGKVGIARNTVRLAAAATTTLLLLSGPVAAQLALSGNMPVPGTGIPFGATGLDSPGLSPAPTGTMGPAGNSTTCSAAGNSSSSLSGPGAIYDGGGIGMGTSSLVNSATCDANSGNAASSAATLASPPSPGGISGAGIPLGSVEISNAGVSPPIAVPAPSFSMPTTNSLPPSTVGTAVPCLITGSPMPATGC